MVMTAQQYAALAAQVGEAAFRLVPNDRSPVAQTANLAVTYLRMAAKEIRRLAEWTAEQEKQEPKS